MVVIDTHAHLNDSAYDGDREEVINRSLENNIWMINVGYDHKSSSLAVEYAERHKEGIFAATALHPDNVSKENFDKKAYREFLQNEKVVAIGETGLDYHRLPEDTCEAARIKQLQNDIFLEHLRLAQDFKKPVIIHCRKANEDILKILEDWQNSHEYKLRGVAHSFVGNYRQARRYRELGFKIAFNGIITYARDYDKVILDTPFEDILIETDCPYLAPAPYRGERNEPIYVIEVAKKLAEVKNVSFEEAIKITTENAKKLLE